VIKGSIAFMAVSGSLFALCGLVDKCMGPSVGKSLTIASAPSGAEVKLDGEPRGTTPLTLTDLDVEEGQVQSLAFNLKGHEPLVEKITWTQAEQTVAVTLKPSLKKRVITVKTIPDDANVYIDGKPRGETPLSFEMEFADADEFNILIQSKGYDDLSKKIVVPSDTLMTLEYNFKRNSHEVNPELDDVLLEYEKKWRNRCHTYNTDDCSFTYTIAPDGEVTNVTDVSCKFKDITGCTRKTAEKMKFPPSDKLRTDSFTWKGKN
jgi:hypothetical protein